FLAWVARTNSWFTLEPQLDLRVLAFALGASLLTGLLVGVYPAVRGTRLDLAQSMKNADADQRSARSAVSRSLMIAQVAISIVLLVGAGLFLRTVHNLRTADVGFDTKNVLLFSADLERRQAQPSEARTIFENLLAEVGQL